MPSRSKSQKTGTVTPEDSAYLMSTDLFAAVPQETREEILACLNPVTVRAGDRFIRQGSEGDCLYIIQKGSCSIVEERSGKTRVVARRTSGDVVGEMAMLTGETRIAHVEAETDMSLWRISRVEFDALCLSYPAIREFFADVMAKRISQSKSPLHKTVGQFLITELDKSNRKLSMLIDRCRTMQSELVLNEQRLRALIANAEDCIFIKDLDLKYTHANPAMLELLRRSEQDVVGKIDIDFFPPEDARYFNDLELRVLAGQSVESEHVIHTSNETRTYKMSRFPMRDDASRIIGLCCIGREIRNDTLDILVSDDATAAYTSQATKAIFPHLARVAPNDSTVLLLGESGSGKDYWAQWIHEHSRRSKGPFHSVNCSALATHIVESELFGHEPGAFTGASRTKRGLLELSEGGSLLLNEIGELSLTSQAKLLTFLDTRQITRVGGEKSIMVDSRIIAATNRDLKKDVQTGQFRADLYHRINVFTINIPPLRDRFEDIPKLCIQLLKKIGNRLGRGQLPLIDRKSLERLCSYDWPGNIRELMNVLERALILCDGDKITSSHLNIETSTDAAHLHRLEGELSYTLKVSPSSSLTDQIQTAKKILIAEALKRTHGNVSAAARVLGISRDVLRHQIEIFDLDY
jgi:PAS domain S-box-containing protein